MKRKVCGIIAELNAKPIKAVIERLTLRAFADTKNTKDGEGEGEGDNNDPSDKGGDTKTSPFNFEDLISKARKEEKDKQYNTIERLKTQVATMTEQHNEDMLKIAGLEKELEKAKEKLTKAGKGDSEEVNTLKETVKTLEGEKKDLSKKVEEFEKNKPANREEIEKEVRAELEKEYEVKTYKASKLAELKDSLLVPELVGGDTKEDIDKSIEAAIARSEEIRKSLGISKSGEGDTQTPPPAKRTPKSPSGAPSGGKTLDLNYLASLDVRSEEYKEVRKKLGLR